MSDRDETAFALDPHLAADTVLVAEWPLSRVLLMDDSRFPWLVLVPRRGGLVELDDLADDDHAQLLREVTRAMQALRTIAPCDKLNVGLLGNIVRQLHVHVVARRKGDAAWPGPVWGFGTAQRHAPGALQVLVERLRAVIA